jgi:hypothetical protein
MQEYKAAKKEQVTLLSTGNFSDDIYTNQSLQWRFDE